MSIAEGCALHGGKPFVAICRRCGSYVCAECNGAGSFDVCPACRGSAGSDAFPFRRDGVVWGAFLGHCFAVYKRNFGLVTLTSLVCLGTLLLLQALSGVVSIFSDDFLIMGGLSLLLLIAQMVAMGALTLGALSICLRLVREQPADLSMLFEGFPRLGALLLQSAITNVALLFACALMCAPVVALFTFGLEQTLLSFTICALSALAGWALLVYLALGFAFSSIELVGQPELDALTALKNGWAIARGERLTLAFGLFIIGVLVCAGVVACGVGLVFTAGYAGLIFSGLYLALRNGAPKLER